MPYVYLDGEGGLGNCLFQVAAAIYYCEKYGYEMRLRYTSALFYGTSNSFGKDKAYRNGSNTVKWYNETIFRKLVFTTDGDTNNIVKVLNHTTDNKIVPEGQDIMIVGYNQNLLLFREYFDRIPKYLFLEDDYIINYIQTKYGDVSNSICVGIRIGEDYKHMRKLNSASYLKALDHLRDLGENIENIYIISDTENISMRGFDLHEYYNCIEVNESDIIQIYFGIMCKNYILSESTFHLWIAYLGVMNENNNKKVVCFNDTLITNSNLCFENWIYLDYVTPPPPIYVPTKTPTYIYFHICCINNYKFLVENTIRHIKDSGLYDHVDKIRCGILGKYDDLAFLNDPKVEIIFTSDDTSIYEKSTLSLLAEHSRTEDFNVLYIHSKGVSHNIYWGTVFDWINYMLHFNITRYKDCLSYLTNYDCVGVNLQPAAHFGIDNHIHYSGNFWWSKSKYIRTIDNLVYDNYSDTEFWITNKNRGNFISLYNSNLNHYCEFFHLDQYGHLPNQLVIHSLFSFMSMPEYLTGCIRNRVPVSFSKYGDGEYYASIYDQGYNGGEYDMHSARLKASLHEAFHYLTNNDVNAYFGLWHDVSKKPFWEEIAKHTHIKWADYHSLILKGDHEREKIELYRTIKASKMKKVIVCNPLLLKSKILLDIDYTVFVPYRNWFENSFDTYLSQVENRISNSTEPMIIITCCGMSAKVLIYELVKKYPSHIYLDFGSALDKICTKRTTRGWEPSYAEFMEKLADLIPNNWNDPQYDSIYTDANAHLGLFVRPEDHK